MSGVPTPRNAARATTSFASLSTVRQVRATRDGIDCARSRRPANQNAGWSLTDECPIHRGEANASE